MGGGGGCMCIGKGAGLLLPPQILISMSIKGISLRLQNESCVTVRVSITMKWDH